MLPDTPRPPADDRGPKMSSDGVAGSDVQPTPTSPNGHGPAQNVIHAEWWDESGAAFTQDFRNDDSFWWILDKTPPSESKTCPHGVPPELWDQCPLCIEEAVHARYIRGLAKNIRDRQEAQELVEAEKRRGLTLEQFSAALLDADQLKSLPDRVHLIHNLVIQGTLVQFNGGPASFKTFICLDIAGCVGGGIPWHNRSTTQGQGLYVLAEGLNSSKYRVKAWETYNRRPMTGVTFYPKRIDVGNPAELAAVQAYVEATNTRLVIFDTLARCTPSIKSENDNAEMSRIVDALAALIDATGVTVFLVHHDGKDGKASGRGAQSVEGACETMLHMEKEPRGPQAQEMPDDVADVVTMTVHKQNNLPGEGNKYCFIVKQVEQSVVLTTSPYDFGGDLITPSQRRDEQLDSIRGLVLDYVTDNPGVTKREIEAKKLTDSRDDVRAAIDHLIRMHQVRVEIQGRAHRHYRCDDPPLPVEENEEE